MLDDGRHQWSVDVWEEHISAARESVGAGGYVTQLIRLDDLDVQRWQYLMDLCAQYELIPIIRLATTYNTAQNWWIAPPQDADNGYATVAQTYADFLAELDWQQSEHLIIVGNEPNHGNEWGGIPNPADYAKFLSTVAQAIHAQDSAAVVMNAGFDHYAPHTGTQALDDGARFMDAESFMDGMVLAQPDIFCQIDAWASHPYPLGAFIQPPWEQTFHIDYLFDAANPNHLTPPDGLFNRGVNAYEWELHKLASYGVVDLPVYITETGWRYSSESDFSNEYPTPAQVMLYLDLALYGNQGRYPNLPETGWNPWQADARVMGVTFFAFDAHPTDWAHATWLEMDDHGHILDTLIMLPNPLLRLDEQE